MSHGKPIKKSHHVLYYIILLGVFNLYLNTPCCIKHIGNLNSSVIKYKFSNPHLLSQARYSFSYLKQTFYLCTDEEL